MTTEKLPTKWTDPKTGNQYVLKNRDGEVTDECEGCAGDNDSRLCAVLPSCRGATGVWVAYESEPTKKGA